MMRLVIILIALLNAGCHSVSEREDLLSVFREHGIKNATFVMRDVLSGNVTVVNGKRAEQRFAPASTFKIANSLIALQTGAVRDTDEVIPYGGKPQMFPQWERDMTLQEAIKVSNVPVYQEVARRIGLSRMSGWVKKLDYGNADIGTVVDRFWLDGPLEISAVEQAHFLARLVKQNLPIDPAIQLTVYDMVFLEEFDGISLYGKTGWLMSHEPNIGWLVGWAVKDGKTYTYALNLDITEEADNKQRLPIVKAMLKKLIR